MKRHRILLSLITIDNDYQLEQGAAAKEVATRLGIDLKVLYADGDSIQQSQQILKYIQAKPEDRPDGIIFEPIGGPALEKAGRQLAVLLPNGGSVLYIQGPTQSDPCKLRTAGLYETKPANIQIRSMKASWTESSAFNAVKSWLTLSTSQHEPVVAVAAQNDAMAAGARKAFQEFSKGSGGAEHVQELHFLGVDGVPSTGQAWVRTSILSATIVAPPLAGNALDLLVRALRTGEVPPEITFLPPLSFPPLKAMKPKEAKQKAAWAG